MTTISNVSVRLDAITPDMFVIEDIAHALHQTNRFNGHARKPYSVLAHSMCAAVMMPSGKKMEGLLHDAAEVYIGDITTPVKELFPQIVEYEDGLLALIIEKYDINHEAHIVNGKYKKSKIMLQTDRRLGDGESYTLRPKCGGTRDAYVTQLMYQYWDATPQDFLYMYRNLL